jgi:hypothetical protein
MIIPITLGFATLLLASAAGKKVEKTLENLKFVPIGVKRHWGTNPPFGVIPLRFIFDIENKNAKHVEFEHFTGNLYLNGNLISPFNAAPQNLPQGVTSVKIPAKGKLTVDVYINLNLITLGAQALLLGQAFANGGNTTLTLQVKGKISALGFNDIRVDEFFPIIKNS